MAAPDHDWKHVAQGGDASGGASAALSNADAQRDKVELDRAYRHDGPAPKVQHWYLPPTSVPAQGLDARGGGGGGGGGAAGGLKMKIMTLNIDTRLAGSNVSAIEEVVLASHASCVCLQEVTIEALRLLQAAEGLASKYAIYSVMDQAYIAKAEKKNRGRAVYGSVSSLSSNKK